MKTITGIRFLILAILLIPYNASGQALPSWWEQAVLEAQKDGYTLATQADLNTLYESGQDILIVDVRPEYEYKSDHLPQAVNMEFHLGDRLELKPQKRGAFQKLLGPDKNRTIVIYCRSFR